MQVIEANRELWYSEAVWDYLSVPKPFRKTGCSVKMDERFSGCFMHWNFGWHIYADRVVICRPGKDDVVYFITTVDKLGKTLTLPDPRFYW